MPTLAPEAQAVTRITDYELYECAKLALHRRLATVRPGRSVAITSRCCHSMPSVREQRIAGEHRADWLRAEREALARVADWARRKGLLVELHSFPGVGFAGFEFRVLRTGCAAYESIVIRKAA